MISLIMPYWNRRELLQQSLLAMGTLYDRLDLEIIIADDGSGLSLDDLSTCQLNVKIISLPRKAVAKNPSVPLNRAEEAASGEYLAITNPEILHTMSILPLMREKIEREGERHYCTAAIWSPDTQRWYNHSTENDKRLGRAPVPKGAGLHFLSMLHRELFDEVGGFDESYREGQGYEDNDFLWKLHEVGATFSILDNLVAHHFRSKVQWPTGGAERNRAIFERKWGRYIEKTGSKRVDNSHG